MRVTRSSDAEGRDRSLRQPVDGSARIDRLFENGEDEWTQNLAVTIVDLGPGRLKLIGFTGSNTVHFATVYLPRRSMARSPNSRRRQRHRIRL